MSKLGEARRYLAMRPGAAEAMDVMALDLMSTGSNTESQKLASRSLGIRSDGIVPRFVLCMGAIARSDEKAARRIAREMVCLAPENERSLYCAVWHSPTLNGNRDLLFFDASRETAFIWLMRSYAALGIRPFNAWAIERYFHDRIRPKLLDRCIQFLGKENTGNIYGGHAVDSRRQYLMETDLVRFIGETVANNDCLHKMMELGYLPQGDVNFLYDGEGVANRAAFDLWSSTTRFIDRNTFAGQPADRFVRLDAVTLPFGNRFYYKWVVFALVQRMWERKRRPSLMRISDQDLLRSRFDELVTHLGWKPSDRVICFHVRENLYDRGNVNNLTQRFRNTDPVKFVKALQLLAISGHRIIRIGSTGSHVYPPIPNFFDYANSDLKSPETDLAIMANAAFYFGTDSGPASVSYIFGHPICVVDFAQLALGIVTGLSVYSPRLFWSKRKQRWLSLQEMIRQPFQYLRAQRTIDENDIEPVENTAEEVCLVLQEFLTRYARDSFLDDATFGPNQIRVKQVFKRNKIVANGLLCERFLERHPFLLPA
jgi:putative glycosyltransferase (TIGR04372 family)